MDLHSFFCLQTGRLQLHCMLKCRSCTVCTTKITDVSLDVYATPSTPPPPPPPPLPYVRRPHVVEGLLRSKTYPHPPPPPSPPPFTSVTGWIFFFSFELAKSSMNVGVSLRSEYHQLPVTRSVIKCCRRP